MVDVIHYDKDGNKIGRSTDDNSVAVLIFIGAIIYGIYYFLSWLAGQVTNWQSMDIPYNYIYGFYYYLFTIPANAYGAGVDWLVSIASGQLTDYKNLNLTISIVIFIVLNIILLLMIRYALKLLNRIGIGYFRLLCIIFLPAIVGVAWFALNSLYLWLTAK